MVIIMQKHQKFLWKYETDEPADNITTDYIGIINHKLIIVILEILKQKRKHAGSVVCC